MAGLDCLRRKSESLWEGEVQIHFLDTWLGFSILLITFFFFFNHKLSHFYQCNVLLVCFICLALISIVLSFKCFFKLNKICCFFFLNKIEVVTKPQ